MDLSQSFEYDNIFIGWSQKDIRIAGNVISFLRDKNIQIEQFEDYVQFIREKNKVSGEVSKKAFYLRIKIWNEIRRECPRCQKKMNIFPVNVSTCTNLRDKKIKSTWMCPDEEGCGCQQYNNKPVEYYWGEVSKLLKKRYGSISIEDLVKIDIDLESIGGYSYRSRGCGGKKER